MFMPVYKSLK